jgi:hypothetical protein
LLQGRIPLFPANREKYRENSPSVAYCCFLPDLGQQNGHIFNELRPNSLLLKNRELAVGIKENNFQNREFGWFSHKRPFLLRLASLFWRLRRATTMEAGLFEIQANHLKEFRQTRRAFLTSHQVYALSVNSERDPASYGIKNSTDALGTSDPRLTGPPIDPVAEIARCFLRLTNLPHFALDRLSRYETTLWRQVGQILLTLDALDRRKPLERNRRFRGCDAFPELRK